MNYLGILFLAASIGAAESQAAVIVRWATLTPGAENPPVVGSAGTGFATVTLDTIAQTFLVEVSFSGLTGVTTAAHIHCCVGPAGNAGVATAVPSFPGFPSGVTSGTYSQLFDMTQAAAWNPAFVTASGGTLADAEARFTANLSAGLTYFNIHTNFRPGGEIRGQLTPEPATSALCAAALAALAVFRRRRA